MKRHAEESPARVALFVSFVVAAVLMIGSGSALAQDLPAGTDCWQTEVGTTAGLPPLPADFFFPGSDPFPGGPIAVGGLPLAGEELDNCACPVDHPPKPMRWVNQHGAPVAPGSRHGLKPRKSQELADPVDTCVRRTGDVNFAGAGVTETVDIELIELSLRSVAPITVTANDGIGPDGPDRFFDVFITEDGVQAVGSMEFTATMVAGVDSTGLMKLGDPNGLHVNFAILFQEAAGGPASKLMTGLSLTFVGTEGTFGADPMIPTLNVWGLTVLVGALLMASLILMARRRKAGEAS